ncbi:MAG TPA: FG-GAP-like repeat-containing protein [Terriglobales bacterium]
MYCTRFVVVVFLLVIFLLKPTRSDAGMRPPEAGQTSATTQLPLSFAGPSNYSAGLGNPDVLAIGDVNGDGHPDLVVANDAAYGVASSVAVLLGNGDGTFQAPTTYTFGELRASSVAIGDLNGDGFPDLAVAIASDNGHGGVRTLLGNGSGAFQDSGSYASGGNDAVSIAITDINKDGHPDVVVANSSAVVGVLVNDGTGSLKPPVKYRAQGVSTDFLTVADVNGDGYPDVVVTNRCPSNDPNCTAGTVSVLLNNRRGGFKAAVSYNAGGYGAAFAVAVGDFNGDGHPDLVVANLCESSDPCGGYIYSGGVSVLLGNGDGSFQTAVTYASGQALAVSVAVGDVNGDGHLDVVVNGMKVGGWGQYVNVLLGNGDGTLQAPVSFATTRNNRGQIVTPVAVADLNGDGRPDLVTGALDTVSIAVLLNTLFKGTSTTVMSSANPSLVNQPVTFTATVASSSPVPDGSEILFYNGSTEIGKGVTKNGVASFTTSFSKAKTYWIHANYQGDAFHRKSSGYVPKGQVVKLN